ncbi:MAG: glycoside hydrolase family 3 C-terminal domain-containing protein, partial [Gemmatimonadaceae bacterium]|nr:glycoside hydrolase family 3 C-terminal domain-containing protein [Chitinophagaceae bacterium]
ALKKTGKPVVLVVMSGRPLILTWEDKNMDAILETWFGGTEAGHAIADLLFGIANPSGKLSMTFPASIGQIPIYYNHKNTGRPIDPNQKYTTKYLDLSNEPLYPFGYGLSYTKFGYSEITLSKTELKAGEKLQVKVTVSNEGNFDGEETVQLYVRDMVGSITRPVKELKGFQKLFLKKGEMKEVTFQISTEDLKFYNQDLKWVYEPGEFKIFAGTDSRTNKEASFRVL